MLPTRWPRWSIIIISLAITLGIIVLGLILEPLAQAMAPKEEPTATPPRLAYAQPLSGECENCHLDEAELQASGAESDELARLLIEPTSTMSRHGQLGCVTCHRGNGETREVEAAHAGLVANPSHYQEAAAVCLLCHYELPTEIPEHHIRAPHDRILGGIREQEQVCSCSNCHGPVAHGETPLNTHAGLGNYCINCHEERQVPAERLKCAGCHIGPHDVAEGLDCDVCHVSTELWSRTELAVHPTEINGRHAELLCFECHTWPHFSELLNYTCQDCHTSPHENFGAGQDCAECHYDGLAWTETQEGAYDHTETWDYAVGAHVPVACRGCHVKDYAALPADCATCHELDEETCNAAQACTDCHLSDVAWSDVEQ